MAEWAGVKELIRKLGKRSGANAQRSKEIWQIVFGWTSQKFSFNVKTAHTLKIHEPHVITVTGKAFYDIGHAPADHSNRRTTPKDDAGWEIQPAMKLQVVQ